MKVTIDILIISKMDKYNGKFKKLIKFQDISRKC